MFMNLTTEESVFFPMVSALNSMRMRTDRLTGSMKLCDAIASWYGDSWLPGVIVHVCKMTQSLPQPSTDTR